MTLDRDDFMRRESSLSRRRRRSREEGTKKMPPKPRFREKSFAATAASSARRFCLQQSAPRRFYSPFCSSFPATRKKPTSRRICQSRLCTSPAGENSSHPSLAASGETCANFNSGISSQCERKRLRIVNGDSTEESTPVGNASRAETISLYRLHIGSRQSCDGKRDFPREGIPLFIR